MPLAGQGPASLRDQLSGTTVVRQKPPIWVAHRRAHKLPVNPQQETPPCASRPCKPGAIRIPQDLQLLRQQASVRRLDVALWAAISRDSMA